jgi:hypothetical protein
MMKRYLYDRIKLGVLILSSIGFTITSYAQIVDEYQLKSAYLLNFARFTEWPNEQQNGVNTPFFFCFLGQDLFGNALEVLKVKPIRERSPIVKRNLTLEQVSQCQIIFISRSEEDNLDIILSTLSRFPILTVSDIDTFTDKGGMIRLVTAEDNRLQLYINLNAVRRVKLKISSKVLALAKIVGN